MWFDFLTVRNNLWCVLNNQGSFHPSAYTAVFEQEYMADHTGTSHVHLQAN